MFISVFYFTYFQANFDLLFSVFIINEEKSLLRFRQCENSIKKEKKIFEGMENMFKYTEAI